MKRRSFLKFLGVAPVVAVPVVLVDKPTLQVMTATEVTKRQKEMDDRMAVVSQNYGEGLSADSLAEYSNLVLEEYRRKGLLL